jgi:hypothetical protein
MAVLLNSAVTANLPSRLQELDSGKDLRSNHIPLEKCKRKETENQEKKPRFILSTPFKP